MAEVYVRGEGNRGNVETATHVTGGATLASPEYSPWVATSWSACRHSPWNRHIHKTSRRRVHQARMDHMLHPCSTKTIDFGTRQRLLPPPTAQLIQTLASSWQVSPNRQHMGTTEAVSLTTLHHLARCANSTVDFFRHRGGLSRHPMLKKCYTLTEHDTPRMVHNQICWPIRCFSAEHHPLPS